MSTPPARRPINLWLHDNLDDEEKDLTRVQGEAQIVADLVSLGVEANEAEHFVRDHGAGRGAVWAWSLHVDRRRKAGTL